MFNKSAVGILVEAYVTGIKVTRISMMLIRCLIGLCFYWCFTHSIGHKSDLLYTCMYKLKLTMLKS